MMETRISCPLGSECEVAKDGYIERCAWYTNILGKDPQSNAEVDSWRCALTWLPILLVENAQTNRGQTEAIHTQTNEQVKGQRVFDQLLGLASSNIKLR